MTSASMTLTEQMPDRDEIHADFEPLRPVSNWTSMSPASSVDTYVRWMRERFLSPEYTSSFA